MGQLFTYLALYIKLFLMKRDPTIITETYNSIIVYKCIKKNLWIQYLIPQRTTE